MCGMLFNTSLDPVNVPLLFICWEEGSVTGSSIMCLGRGEGVKEWITAVNTGHILQFSTTTTTILFMSNFKIKSETWIFFYIVIFFSSLFIELMGNLTLQAKKGPFLFDCCSLYSLPSYWNSVRKHTILMIEHLFSPGRPFFYCRFRKWHGGVTCTQVKRMTSCAVNKSNDYVLKKKPIVIPQSLNEQFSPKLNCFPLTIYQSR